MIYEYQCEDCEKIFEVEQRITEDPLEDCVDEECSGCLKRLISNTSFVLKGGGWFNKDGY